MQKFYDCGIDLGTTNSCLAIPDNDHGYEIIENQSDRMNVTPSAVLINGKGRMITGQRAYNSQKVEDLAIQFKRQMGTDKVIKFESASITKTPEELSSEILKVLKKDAENRLNRNIENVVITVPAAFKTLQSEATNKAGKLAGFKNIILLQEPIAAAVAYGAKPESDGKHWMVFDYGGGTLDVAIISTLNKRLSVENSEGDNYLGGSDIDKLIYKNIVYPKLIEEGYAVNDLLDESTSEGKSVVRKILLDCERCKIELSNQTSSIIELFDLEDDNGDDIEIECEVSRNQIESLISETVEKTINIAKKALAGTNVKAEQLDKILLVGGSTFIPLVRQRLTEEFKVELDSSINPMTVVAAGAAIYASTSVIEVEDVLEETNSENAVISLTFDPISSEESVNVIGKVINIEKVKISKIKVDCAKSVDFSGVIWTSGWVELMDQENGIIDIDVLLQKGSLNHFRLYACDENGKEIKIDNPDFEIKHNENVLKTSAPPATMSIGVQIRDNDTGYDILYQVIKKNTPLPASSDKTFKLSRDIDPSKDDCITIKIWEGENIDNPEANFPAGEITVKSSAMNRPIPKDTDVELTITADENRNIRVSGYIPDFDYEIPEETLRPESRVNLEDRLDIIETKLKNAEVSINNLKRKGIDVTKEEKRLEIAKSKFEDTYNQVESDEASVNNYIEDFYDVESDIIKKERKHLQASNIEDDRVMVEEARESINDYGDNEAKEMFEELEESYRLAENKEEKMYIAKKMEMLSFRARINNFDYLESIYEVISRDKNIIFSNPSQASYWKTEAKKAIKDYNISNLREAIFNIVKLITKSSNQAISAFGSDLTM